MGEWCLQAWTSGRAAPLEEALGNEMGAEGEDGVFVNSFGSHVDRLPAVPPWMFPQAVRGPECPPSAGGGNCPPAPGSAEERPGSPQAEPHLEEPQPGLQVHGSRSSSIVDRLLVELYDTYQSGFRTNLDSVDSSTEASSSDAFLGRSNTGANFLQELQERQTRSHQRKYLAQKDTEEMKRIVQELDYRIGVQSAKLIRQLKRKDRLLHKVQKNCDIVTACLQAVSPKRRVDTKLKFTLEPSLGKNGFQQWYDALKAVARLPTGIPREWRRRVWLTLADHYLHSIAIDWEKTMRFTFNDRSNPDDDSMGVQIVKKADQTVLFVFRQIENCQNADEFYSAMGRLTQEMLENDLIDSNEIMQTVYSMAAFPFPQLAELREKYTYNITPFPAPVKTALPSGKQSKNGDSDEEFDMDDEDAIANAIGCLGPFSGLIAPELQKSQKSGKDQREEQSLRSSNIAELSPGAVDSNRSDYQAVFNSMMMERMTTDINALKRQYSRIKRRQQQQAHHVYITAGSEEDLTPGIKQDPREKMNNDKGPVTSLLPSQVNQSPVINHLLLGKKIKSTNRAARNTIVHVPGSKASQIPHEDLKTKLNSPWRTHIRVHRKNIARAKGQLGYGDTIGLIENQSDRFKDGSPKAAADPSESPDRVAAKDNSCTEDRRVAKADGQSPKLVYNDADANLSEVQQKLETLELNQAENGEAELAQGQRCQGHFSDSSESESGASAKTPRLASPELVRVFSPFPSVKPLKKSAAARNLGLYGPTERTPALNFPQMSRSVNCSVTSSSGTRRR
nr:PREDICTED: TBC1 domain family member 30 [Latimeria chalumnae]|eukprot:XP_005989516.1 PREDICTED: TBC1 domain family member 30 [Latimeria chalumnae]